MSREYDGIGPWRCSECGHDHTGRKFAYICIGCPCDFVPDHPVTAAHLGRIPKDGAA
jgi:hypothetical protein